MGLKRILDKLLPGDNINTNGNSDKITNEVLRKRLVNHFIADMDELTVGRRVLYPMSYNIILLPDDYKRVGESLPFILPEVVAGFYEAIQAKSETIKNACFIPPSTSWYFQFAAGNVKTEDGKESFIKPGDFATVGRLKSFDISKVQQGTLEDNSYTSIKCTNSNVKANINPKALLGIEIITNNVFSFKFDENMSQSREDILASQRNNQNALGIISYSENGSTRKISMLDDLVILSGPSDTRNLGNIIRINHEAVQVGHIQIRYLKETNRFQLCAYSKARLSQIIVPLSAGGNPIWVDMSYNSDIFLNDAINVEFHASDSIIAQNR